MTETWLHPNRRVLALALVPALLMAAIGGLLFAQFAAAAARIAGTGAVVVGVALIVGLQSQMRKPRVAYRDEHVLFNLRAGPPIAVPASLVEAFFVGQGPAHLPGVSNGKTETVNLVARISQRAADWAHQDVKRALGNWCHGYVTIRGTWCEPLTNDVVRRLNRRLKEVHEGLGPTPPEAKP